MAVLALMGDVMLGRLVNESLRRHPAESVWGDLLPLLRAADWRACNLECVISDLIPEMLPEKEFHFRSDARNVAVLEAARIDAVSCANNHSLDFGPDAMLDMLRLLDSAGIAHAGGGSCLDEARLPALSAARDGTPVALLSCTDNEPGWAASEDRPGVWFVPTLPGRPELDDLLERVRRAKLLAEVVIISYHWGTNWGRLPEPGHLEVGTALLEAGADVVLGHSCHVFRGVAVKSRGAVIHSAGNFLDDYAVDPVERNDEDFLFELETGPAARRLRMLPTIVDELLVRRARPEEAREIREKMRRLCAGQGTEAVSEADGLVISLDG